MNDFVTSISLVLEKITGIKSAVEAGDDVEVLRLARETDWAMLIDEFESVVSGYRFVIRMNARVAIHNLLKPYIQMRDDSKLMTCKLDIEDAIEESPSLAGTADEDVEVAWESQIKLFETIEKQSGRGFRRVEPILTLTDLFREITAKQEECWKLERTDPAYCQGERIPRP